MSIAQLFEYYNMIYANRIPFTYIDGRSALHIFCLNICSTRQTLFMMFQIIAFAAR